MLEGTPASPGKRKRQTQEDDTKPDGTKSITQRKSVWQSPCNAGKENERPVGWKPFAAADGETLRSSQRPRLSDAPIIQTSPGLENRRNMGDSLQEQESQSRSRDRYSSGNEALAALNAPPLGRNRTARSWQEAEPDSLQWEVGLMTERHSALQIAAQGPVSLSNMHSALGSKAAPLKEFAGNTAILQEGQVRSSTDRVGAEKWSAADVIPDTEDPDSLPLAETECVPETEDALAIEANVEESCIPDSNAADIGNQSGNSLPPSRQLAEQHPSTVDQGTPIAETSCQKDAAVSQANDIEKEAGVSSVEPVSAIPESHTKQNQIPESYAEESELPEYDDPDMTLPPELSQQLNRHANSREEDVLEETELPEYDDPDMTQLPQNEDFPDETELPEYIEEDLTQAPRPTRNEGYTSEVEAELDDYLEDDDLEPPSDVDEEEPMMHETDQGPQPAGDYVPDSGPTENVGDQSRQSPSPVRQQAKHSWLIRSPPPALPVRRVPAAQHPAQAQVHETPNQDNSVCHGRQILLPQKEPGAIDGMIMPITSSEGEQVYCLLMSGASSAQTVSEAKCTQQRRPLKLLSHPIDSLMEEVEQEAYLRAVAASTADPNQTSRGLLAKGNSSSESDANSNDELWVNKYSPHTFLDLLSDELINKEVLRWLKSWDHCVFGSSQCRGSRVKNGKLQPVKGPPEQKILLLAGAPGLGKTTLAHVIAKHCGYRPVEINASDDRTGTSLQARIVEATHMQPVMGAKLPNCVIIDEIDGAAGGAEGKSAVGALLKLISGTPGGNQSDEPAMGGAFRRPKKKGTPPLNRPLIAICNDLYAPVLRPLRSVAKIVTFKATQAAKLVTRLQVIAAREKIAVDRQALMVLAEKSDRDVRACLNTLQFLSKQHLRIRVADVNRTSVGQKDSTKDIFSIWNDLLCSKDLRQSKLKGPQDQLYRALGDFGDHELVLSGVHHNMLARKFIDTQMQLTCQVFDQIHAADAYLTAVRHTMDFSLMAYLPAPILSIRAIVASPDRSRLQWPKSAMDHPRLLAANSALLHAWLLSVSHSVYSSLRTSSTPQDFIPCLVRVLQQPIRAVASSLLNLSEKKAMTSIVALLISYGLTFDTSVADSTSDTSALVLKPEIHSLCAFESFPGGKPSMQLAVRQMIAQQVNEERMRLKSLRLGDENEGAPGGAESRHGGSKNAGAQPGGETQRPPSAGSKLMYTVAERAVNAGADATRKVGRQSNWLEAIRESKQKRRPSVMQQAGSSKSASGTDVKSHLAALYKYKEGFTNAVKRPLQMKDLL